MEQNAPHISGLIRMKRKDSQTPRIEKKTSMTNNFIILIFTISSLLFESLIIIISLFKKGILKKEVLSKKSNLGFDLIIKRK